MRVLVMIYMLACAAACAHAAQSSKDDEATTVAVETSGDAVVGEEAPWFGLWTPEQQVINLNTLTEGRDATAIVFAAEWCAPCHEGLERLRRGASMLDAAGVKVLVISIDEDADTAEWLSEAGFEGRWVHDRFGVVAEAMGASATDAGGGLRAQVPLTLVVDSEKVVRAIFRAESDDYVDRIVAAVADR